MLHYANQYNIHFIILIKISTQHNTFLQMLPMQIQKPFANAFKQTQPKPIINLQFRALMSTFEVITKQLIKQLTQIKDKIKNVLKEVEIIRQNIWDQFNNQQNNNILKQGGVIDCVRRRLKVFSQYVEDVKKCGTFYEEDFAVGQKQCRDWLAKYIQKKKLEESNGKMMNQDKKDLQNINNNVQQEQEQVQDGYRYTGQYQEQKNHQQKYNQIMKQKVDNPNNKIQDKNDNQYENEDKDENENEDQDSNNTKNFVNNNNKQVKQKQKSFYDDWYNDYDRSYCDYKDINNYSNQACVDDQYINQEQDQDAQNNSD